MVFSTDEPVEMQVEESSIKSTDCEKLFGVKVDSKLTFDSHIKTLGKKQVTN